MAIPGWQDILLPFLQLAEDGTEHTLQGAKAALADHFQLTQAERLELLSGSHRTFDNRVEWAKAYLVKAKIIESTGHGKFKITERGKAILSIQPQNLNLKFLSIFEEIIRFRNPRMPKVFISHGNDSIDYCHMIVKALESQGCDVWFDENNFANGHIVEVLQEEIISREHFVLILSPVALSSQWVKQEYSAALELLKIGDVKTFVPILAQLCDVPIFIKNFRIISNAGMNPIPAPDAAKQLLSIIKGQ
jgi:hypothetical protein